jgi:hypothetical protein
VTGRGAAGSASSSSDAAGVFGIFKIHINDCDQSCIAGIPDHVR